MSTEADLQAKGVALQTEFDAILPERLRMKEVNMCNYSDFVWNKGKEKGKEEGIKEGIREG